jgi:hypothetical protein
MSSDLRTYIGLGLGVVSILATIYFALRFAERKDPRLHSLYDRKIAVSKDAPADIEVRYRGSKVERVASTYIWFWNAGKRPILKTDIPAAQPIQVTLIGPGDTPVQILDTLVRKTTRASIAFEAATVSANSVRLTFDFLDTGDGGVVEIQHDGAAGTVVRTQGVILGVPKGIKTSGRRPLDRMSLLPLIALAGLSRRAARNVKLIRFLVAPPIVLLAVGAILSSYAARHDITTSSDVLYESLRGYVIAGRLDSAVAGVLARDKYPFLNGTAWWLVIGLVAVLLAVILAGLLFSPKTFPVSLTLDERDSGRANS